MEMGSNVLGKARVTDTDYVAKNMVVPSEEERLLRYTHTHCNTTVTPLEYYCNTTGPLLQPHCNTSVTPL
jgi:hypothetical protein